MTITSNDPETPQISLALEGEIESLVVATPQQLRVAGLAGTVLSGEVVLSPGAELGFEVTGVTARKSQCTVAAIEDRGDGTFRIAIEAAAADRPSLLRDILVVAAVASDGSTHEVRVPIAIDHQNRIVFAPRGNVTFQRRDTRTLETPGAAPPRREVHVDSSSPDIRFHIKQVELLDVPAGVFDTEVRTIEEGKRYVITILLREFRTEPSIRGRLRISTDDPECPEKELRLYAQFGDPK